MSMVFALSHQPAEISAETSAGVLVDIVRLIVPGFSALSPEEQADIVSAYQELARKAAHITEFFVLGALLMLAWLQYPYSMRRKITLSGLISFAYAGSDEFH
jgi:VanZ family protein